ncbi:MAG TPA: hypothetical protein VGR89_03075 [Puia sp.]|nr:hypothetical protein [Puia sp.]
MAGLTRQNYRREEIAVGGQLEPIEPVYTQHPGPQTLSSHLNTPSETAENTHRAPYVLRGQDTRGMRYLYADMRQRQDISPLGTGPDIGVGVWSSEFQPKLGTLRDYGFYDLLYRAGYPGFNLGLSFKIEQTVRQITGPGYNMRMHTRGEDMTEKVLKARGGGRPPWKRTGRWQ